jgi:ABC-type transport system involved in cytochrome c biogenesis permease subunit
MSLLCLGWFVNLAIFVLNWIACGQPPFGNMYHVLIFLSLTFLPLYSIIALRFKFGWTHLYFAFLSAIPLIGSLCMNRNVFWRRVPALQSGWFVPHVFSYMVSYALAAVAFVLIVIKYIDTRNADDKYSAASCQILRLAFPFMTFGLCSGALWAEEAWGVYWSWDIIYFHCRYRPGFKPLSDIVQILAFFALLTTFLLVNLLPKLGSILHSYA